MKRKIQLWLDTETGKITDEWGGEYSIPNKEEAGVNNPQYHTKGLDIEGGVTVTGNLTVQQSQWVYLRGPITGSRVLINGPITASNLWVRNAAGGSETPMEGMGYLRVDEDMEVGGVSVKELIGRIENLETQLKELKQNR